MRVRPITPNVGGGARFAARSRPGKRVPPLTRVERDERGFFVSKRKPLLTLLLERSGAVEQPNYAKPAGRKGGAS